MNMSWPKSEVLRVIPVAGILMMGSIGAVAVPVGIDDTTLCVSEGTTIDQRTVTGDLLQAQLPNSTLSGECNSGRYTTSGAATVDVAQGLISIEASVNQSGASTLRRIFAATFQDKITVTEGAYLVELSATGSFSGSASVTGGLSLFGDVFPFAFPNANAPIVLGSTSEFGPFLPEFPGFPPPGEIDLTLFLQITLNFNPDDGEADIQLRTRLIPASEDTQIVTESGVLPIAAIPESGTIALLGVGLLWLGFSTSGRGPQPRCAR
jgi:hypothetical protein